MKGTAIREAQKALIDKPKSAVDANLGKQRDRVDEPDWNGCPLAMKYPHWDMFHEALYHERINAAAEGRNPHPAATPPKPSDRIPPEPVVGVSAARAKRGF